MAIFDALRVGEIKAELERTKAELERTKADRDTLKATLSSTEYLTYFGLQEAIAKLNQDRAALLQEVATIQTSIAKQQEWWNKQLTELNREAEFKRAEIVVFGEAVTVQASIAKQQEWWNKQLVEVKREVDSKRAEIVVLDDEILLQSSGFYKMKYDLANSQEYLAKLEQIRKEQQAMIKNGTATHCPTNWTLNNDKREGERMIKDFAKLILRAFNNECDTSIATVKFNNVEAIANKIRKALEVLNKLAGRMSISITFDYLTLKLQELYLCHEYQMKKQEEKEEQKRIREQMREEAKIQKEIEELKLKVAKEEKHFSRALEAINEQIQRASSHAEQELLENEKASIVQRLAEVEHTKQDVLNRERNTRAGYVYIISNLGSFGEHIYKIGVTRRLDPQERVDELGDASVPFGFDVHAMIFSDDAPGLENALHKAFEHRRLNMINRRREFFHVTLEEIEGVVRTTFSKPVEVVRLPEASEYRQSLALRSAALPQVLSS
jgi:septal ring factor EnvC (AmiA/AmiB activator)